MKSTILVLICLLLSGCAGVGPVPTPESAPDPAPTEMPPAAPPATPRPDPSPAPPPAPAPKPAPEPTPQPSAPPEPEPAPYTLFGLNIEPQQAHPTIGAWAAFNVTAETDAGVVAPEQLDVEATSGTVTEYADGVLRVMASRGEPQTLSITASSTNSITETLAIDPWGAPIAFSPEPGPQHTIRPGIESSVCTTNFLFHYQYERYFLGSAAHCIDDSDDTNGCNAAGTPIGAAERLEGGVTGTVAYNGWTAMIENGEGSNNACYGHDWALIEIPQSHWAQMHPKAHGVVGHVKGLGDCRDLSSGVSTADPLPLVAYGRSNLRSGLGLLGSPDRPVDDKQGVYLGDAYGGQKCNVYLATPGIPGDSGGPLATTDGLALGAASTISLLGGSNHYTNIAASLESMRAYVGWAPELVTSA